MTTLHTKVKAFQVIHFMDEGKPIIILYALGEDGIMYECTGGKWMPLPIKEDTIKELPVVNPTFFKPDRRN
jgi:hypothetical protein